MRGYQPVKIPSFKSNIFTLVIIQSSTSHSFLSLRLSALFSFALVLYQIAVLSLQWRDTCFLTVQFPPGILSQSVQVVNKPMRCFYWACSCMPRKLCCQQPTKEVRWVVSAESNSKKHDQPSPLPPGYLYFWRSGGGVSLVCFGLLHIISLRGSLCTIYLFMFTFLLVLCVVHGFNFILSATDLSNPTAMITIITINPT